MANLDLILLLVFGTISVAAVTGLILSLRMAVRSASAKDGDVKMFFWALLGLVCVVIAGMSAGYILLPIAFHHLGL